MHVINSKFKLPDSRKLINFGKYFLISLLLLLGLHFVAYANNPEVIIQPEWTTNLESNTQLITTGEHLFVIENQKFNGEQRDYSSTLFAINTASGKVQWQQKLPPYQTLGSRQLILENGTIYASHDNGVVGFDPATGSPKISFKYVEEMSGGTRDRLMGIHQDIAVYGDSIAIDESGSSLAGYQTKVFGITKDKTLWSYQLPKTNGLIGIQAIKPVVQNGILLLPSFHDTTAGRLEQFTVMDVVSGKVLWTWEAPQDPNGLWDADVFGDTIYTSVFGHTKTQPSGRIRAIALQTGKEKWSYVITGKVRAVSDREVLVWEPKRNSQGDFVVLDKETGRFLRRFTVTREYDNEPQQLTWVDGRVYIEDMEIKNVTYGFYGSADNNSWISAFDDKTGKLVWRTPTLMNSHIYYPPVVSVVADKSEKKRLIFASNFLRTEGNSRVQSFSIP
jgi:outer membrane protein assembly factor BamB